MYAYRDTGVDHRGIVETWKLKAVFEQVEGHRPERLYHGDEYRFAFRCLHRVPQSPSRVIGIHFSTPPPDATGGDHPGSANQRSNARTIHRR